MKNKETSPSPQESTSAVLQYQLRLLAETSLRLNQLESQQEVAEFVCSQIKAIIGAGYVAATLLDETTQTLSVRALLGLDDPSLINSGLRLTSTDPRSMHVHVNEFTEEDKKVYSSGRLELLENGFYDLLMRRFPKAVCGAIERLLNAHFVYSMGLMYRGRHMGGIAIVTGSEITVESGKFIIENIINQAATMIGRLYAERMLRESEIFNRESLKNSPNPILITNKDTTIRYVNPAFERLTGYTLDETIGIPAPFPWWPRERISELQQAVREGQEKDLNTLELEYIKKNGQQFYVTVRISPVKSGEEIKFYVSNWIDTTARMVAEEALRSSEADYRSVYDNAQEGMCRVSPQGTFLRANRALAAMLRYNSAEELINSISNSSTELWVRPEDRLAFLKAIRQDGEVLDFECQHKRHHGSPIWVSIRARRVVDENGQHIYTEGFFRDVTEYRKGQEQLKESEERHKLLFESAPLAINMTRGTTIVYANPAYLKMFQISSLEELQNLEPLELFTQEWRPSVMENIQRRQQGLPVPSSYEVECIKKDGIRFPVLMYLTRATFADGPATVAFLEDVTERKELEEKAQRASRLAAVGQMAAGVAHEINNPLTAVLGFSNLLLEKNNLPPDLRDDISLIADNSRRAAEIVKKLLTFSRQSKPVRKTVDLIELINNTLSVRAYVLKTVNIETVTQFDPDVPTLVLDPGQMQEVFLNLIVNAEQAMKTAHGKGILTITTQKRANSVRISFQDNGPGISKENLRRLFNPFFTTKPPGEGTGLGLSVSRSIVLEHGGQIDVWSEANRGANFYIDLPINSSADVSPHPTNSLIAEKLKGRVLVIDDEAGVRGLIRKVLGSAILQVTVAADASEALVKLSEADFDAVLLDIRLPGMSGLELYARIRDKWPSLARKIIFITGDVMDMDVKSFLDENYLPYLAKPFEIDMLREKIGAIIKAG